MNLRTYKSKLLKNRFVYSIGMLANTAQRKQIQHKCKMETEIYLYSRRERNSASRKSESFDFHIGKEKIYWLASFRSVQIALKMGSCIVQSAAKQRMFVLSFSVLIYVALLKLIDLSRLNFKIYDFHLLVCVCDLDISHSYEYYS